MFVVSQVHDSIRNVISTQPQPKLHACEHLVSLSVFSYERDDDDDDLDRDDDDDDLYDIYARDDDDDDFDVDRKKRSIDDELNIADR